jgi:hypothetical protein
MVCPRIARSFAQLGQLGYRPVAADWEVGITEYRKP